MVSDASLDRFRALVVASEALQTELALCAGRDRFVDVAIAAAARNGLGLTAADLAPLFAIDPLGLLWSDSASVTLAGWPPSLWLPVQMSVGHDGAMGVDWAHFADAPLAAPFYTQSSREALARPLNRLVRFRTPLEDFIAAAAGSLPAVDGFIFHMSHCGSTLTARMLAALPGTTVVSEAPPLDSMVHLAFRSPWPAERRIAALRAMVAALGRGRSGGGRRLFFKLNFWHALALPLFRQAFPATPWLFLHREPAAVLAAQMRERGPELVPEIMPSEIYEIQGGMEMPAEHYCARAIARVCAAALDEADSGGAGLILDYDRLPDAVGTAALPHFGMACGAAERAAMAVVAGRDAKRPRHAFRPGAAGTGPEVRAAAEEHLGPLHRRLAGIAAPAKLR